MFMKISKEININESERGFEVVLFDNRKGGKDHGVKLISDVRHTFTRIVRNGWVVSNKGGHFGINADIAYAQFHEAPVEQRGFKIEDVKVDMQSGHDGKQGVVTALIRPFGPRYVEQRDAIAKHEEMDFQLLHTVNDKGEIWRVLGVGYKPREASMKL